MSRSMFLWLVVVAMALCSRISAAQNDSDPWGVNAWHQQHEMKPIEYYWNQASNPAQQLERIHELLMQSENHDAYLSLAWLGTKETVPILLERLRLDYGESEPPAGVLYGLDCAQEHLIDALRSITNSDQGLYYPKWKAWWDANKDFSQHQWMMNGFANAGLHPVESVDERFGLELIGWMAERQQYKNINANRELSEVPAQARSQWIALAAAQSATLKRGALATLRGIDKIGNEEVLRTLARDPDPDIRRTALSLLNERLRSSRVAPNASVRLLRPPREHGRSNDLVFVGDDMLVASFEDRVQAFQVPSGRILWTRKGAARYMVVANDRIVLSTDENELIALSFAGRDLWRKTNLDIRSLASDGTEVLVVRDTETDHPGRIDRIDVATGGVLTSVTTEPLDSPRNVGQEAEESLQATEYGLLVESSEYAPELRDFDTGEVILNWPQLRWHSKPFVVSKNYVAIRGSSGELWLIDLDKIWRAVGWKRVNVLSVLSDGSPGTRRVFTTTNENTHRSGADARPS